MVDSSGLPDLSQDPTPKQRPLGVIAAVVTFVILLAIGYWITQEKSANKVQEEALAVMDKQLTDDEAALKEQRDKLTEVSRQVEEMRAGIEMGQYKDGKAAVVEFNKLAASQRAEREKYTQMAEAYNKKVAEYRKLEK